MFELVVISEDVIVGVLAQRVCPEFIYLATVRKTVTVRISQFKVGAEFRLLCVR